MSPLLSTDQQIAYAEAQLQGNINAPTVPISQYRVTDSVVEDWNQRGQPTKLILDPVSRRCLKPNGQRVFRALNVCYFFYE
jgi:hypothetical protein